MTTSKLSENYYLEHRCPRCSAKLMSDGELVWCSLLDGDSMIACEFGHDRDVPITHLEEFTFKPDTADSDQ